MILTKQNLKQKISEYMKKYSSKNFIQWNGGLLSEWEYHLLIDINAISPTAIKCEYPVAKYQKEDGSSKTEDIGGDLYQITKKVSEFNSSVGLGAKVRAKVEYIPRAFMLFREIGEDGAKSAIVEKENLRKLEQTALV